MNNRMKNLMAFLLSCVAGMSSAATASATDVHEMADICMYAQRILKDYAMVGMGVTYHDPAADLKHGAETVDKYLADIESHHLKKELDDEVRAVHRLWSEIEPELLATPDKTKMHDLRVKVEALTKRCEHIADELAKDTGIAGEHDVVLIAELGMESQRLAALYMMKAWGVADPEYFDQVKEILDEYEQIHAELMAEDEKLVSAEIKGKLKETEDHFRVLAVMSSSKSGRFVPMLAERSASAIFDELREILKLEEALVE